MGGYAERSVIMCTVPAQLDKGYGGAHDNILIHPTVCFGVPALLVSSATILSRLTRAKR